MTDLSPLVNEILKSKGAKPIAPKALSIEQISGFLQDAYNINKRVSELLSYLRGIRQPYLSTAPPPRRKNAAHSTQHLTDPQRDQIDAECKSYLRDLHAAVNSLVDAEHSRQAAEAALAKKRTGKYGLGALGNWASGGGILQKSPEEEEKEAEAHMIKVHREGVIWLLQRKLEECGRVQSRMMEIRLNREMEKSKSVLHKAKGSHVPIWEEDNVKTSARQSTASQSFDPSDPSNPSENLSEEQMQLFAQENKDLLKNYEEKLDQVRMAESSLVEISELQSQLVANLDIQSAHIDQLVQDSLFSAENVGKGNKELKKASERRSIAKTVFYGTSAFCSVLVLWDFFT